MACFIPLQAPSMNVLLQVIWHQRKFETKPEVRLFRTQFKQFLPVWEPPKEGRLRVRFTFHQPWYTQTGSIKRQDAPNLIKACLDALCERYGIDDCRIWDLTSIKQDDEKVGVFAEMEVMADGMA